MIAAASLLVLCGLAVTIGYKYYFSRSTIRSVAVMPFANDSGSVDNEYLSDGMTETLINSLSKVSGLNVKAASTVFHYKGKEINAGDVARDLGVQAILTGRLTQRGDQLVLNLELIDPTSQNLLWGNKYERKASDIVLLQSDVARDVSRHLTPDLSATDAAKVQKSYTRDPEAYQLYLKGRFYARQFTLDGFNAALDAFGRASAMDPNYALAYAGLSLTYFYGSTIHLPPNEALPKADQYARRAIELDPELPAAHWALANVLLNYERDPTAADQEFQRAISMDPNDTGAYFDYTWLLSLNNFEKAVQISEAARRLEPNDGLIAANAAQPYILTGRYEDGIRKAEAAVDVDPKIWWSHYWKGVGYAALGKHDLAIEALETASKMDDSPIIQGALANALASAGRRPEAQKIVSKLVELSKSKFVSESAIAMGYAGLGDKDSAFLWLQRSADSHDELSIWLRVHPFYASLRDDPRYRPMLKTLRVPE